jgi:hypothetical protein
MWLLPAELLLLLLGLPPLLGRLLLSACPRGGYVHEKSKRSLVRIVMTAVRYGQAVGVGKPAVQFGKQIRRGTAAVSMEKQLRQAQQLLAVNK